MIGFLLGIKHATDADHLAAVATLVTRQHSLTQSMTALIGGLSCALGIFTVYRIGVAGAMWLGDPRLWMRS